MYLSVFMCGIQNCSINKKTNKTFHLTLEQIILFQKIFIFSSEDFEHIQFSYTNLSL